ncbi:hypothetical protein MauCBS54593_003387 [Microsporum audouinii]
MYQKKSGADILSRPSAVRQQLLEFILIALDNIFLPAALLPIFVWINPSGELSVAPLPFVGLEKLLGASHGTGCGYAGSQPGHLFDNEYYQLNIPNGMNGWLFPIAEQFVWLVVGSWYHKDLLLVIMQPNKTTTYQVKYGHK